VFYTRYRVIPSSGPSAFQQRARAARSERSFNPCKTRWPSSYTLTLLPTSPASRTYTEDANRHNGSVPCVFYMSIGELLVLHPPSCSSTFSPLLVALINVQQTRDCDPMLGLSVHVTLLYIERLHQKINCVSFCFTIPSIPTPSLP